MNKLEISLAEDVDGNFQQIIHFYSQNVTADDLLTAFEHFCAEKTDSCYGCVGCCQERVPLTAVDAERLLLLLPSDKQNWQELCHSFLEIELLPNGACDIRLKRNGDGSCIFMDKMHCCCNIHPYRTFACATHYCLPRHEEIDFWRSLIINRGMDELVKILIETGCIKGLRAEDYPNNYFSGKHSYAEINLAELKQQSIISD